MQLFLKDPQVLLSRTLAYVQLTVSTAAVLMKFALQELWFLRALQALHHMPFPS